MTPVKMYASAGYSGYIRGYPHAIAVDNIKDADVLLLAGGADINPAIYKHDQHHTVYMSRHRDSLELADIEFAITNKMPIVGTCRGAQMLTAIGGGSLYQDIEHPGHHAVTTIDGKKLYTNSLHHQMCNITDIPHELLAWSENLSDGHHIRWDKGYEQFVNDHIVEKEPEVFILPELKALCIQGHPEMGMPKDFREWWNTVVENFYTDYVYR